MARQLLPTKQDKGNKCSCYRPAEQKQSVSKLRDTRPDFSPDLASAILWLNH